MDEENKTPDAELTAPEPEDMEDLPKESCYSELAAEQKLEEVRREAYRKGRRRGTLRTIIVCLVIAVCAVGVIKTRSDKTTVAVTVTDEDGEQSTEYVTYDSLLDSETVDKINKIAAAIQSSYYEDVDTEELTEGLFQGLFNALDVYSQYYTAEEYADLYATSIEGSYSGIGATLQEDADTGLPTVIKVQSDSPAEEAGIQVGDVLIAADEYESADMDLTEFVSHVKGEEGTTVVLTVYREGEEDYLEIEVERRQLTIESVVWEMLENDTGYIQISEFSDSTTEQFEEALTELTEAGMTGLIVDLRDNPGGTLTSVVEILEYIVPEGLIVYTQDKYGNTSEYESTGENAIDIPLAVLVNGSSASASEIFAGAVKDQECGTLIGTTTYGKGIVQGLQELSDGSAIKMTISRYYTPNGVCIQGTGIEPDIELEYEFLGGEDDSYDYSLDNQIQAALDVLAE